MTAHEQRSDRAGAQTGVFTVPPRLTPEGHITAEAVFTSDSPWFRGHFPGEPILPGIAQLALVLDTIRSVGGHHFQVAGMRRVRFRQVVKPHDRLIVTVVPPGADRPGYRFRLSAPGGAVCSGTLDMV